MAVATEAQHVVHEIASLPREQIIRELLNFEGRARLDFTEEFLAPKSVEHLRHILVAAKLHLS